MKNTDIKLYDKRTLRRNLDQGTLKKDEVNQFINSLPDDSEEAETVNFEALLEDPSLLPPVNPVNS